MTQSDRLQHEILVIQCARMGDLVQTLPLLRTLKKHFSPCRITLIHDARYTDWIDRLAEVDRHVGLDVARFLESPVEQILDAGRFRQVVEWLRPLRETHFDLLCNLNYAASCAILASILRARRRLGYIYEPSGHRILHQGWFTYLVALSTHRRHNGFNLSEIFMRGSGVTPGPASLFSPRPPAGPVRTIGIQIGASEEKKRWPDASFARLIDLIRGPDGREVVLFGAPPERPLADRILARVRKAEGIRADFDTPVSHLPEAYESIDLLVTPDTGPMHLAARCGLPTLALFTGSSFYVETAPWTENTVVLQAWTKANPCSDRGACCTDISCHSTLTPEWVYDVLERQSHLVESGASFASLTSGVIPPRDTLLAVPAFAEGTLSYGVGGDEEEAFEREFFKAFWLGVLGPNGEPRPHIIEGARVGVETLQTAQLLYSSLTTMESGSRPEERRIRMQRNLADLKSKFPEFGLIFDYYGLQMSHRSVQSAAHV